jgi:hypothetical protein
MKLTGKLLGSLLVCVVMNFSYGQELFSPARDKFVKEFAKYLAAYDGQLSRQFMKDLEPVILNGTIPDDYFKRMVATCNLMDAKKLKAFPEVYNYVFSVYSFVVNKQPQSSFAAWHESVDKMLDSRNVSRFKDFIGASANFFSAGVLNETRNYQWKIRGGQYVFRYEKDGPVIEFTNSTLACYIINTDDRTNDKIPFKDSAVVYNTTGVFDVLKDRWDGKGGKVTWVKVGLPESETFAMLTSYRISLKTTNYNCDTVTLTTPYFSKPIKGTLSERTMNFARDIDKVFPQFISFDKKLAIKNIMPDVDYEGGFALKGASFVGVGTQAEKASMIFYRQQRPFVRVSSQEVQIDDKMMITNNASIHMTIGLKDSIFHPGANVAFFRERNALELNRGKTGISMAPFIDSYHKLEVYVDRIIWDRKNPELIFKWGEGISQEQRIARFESLDYYNGQLYDRLGGTTGTHPLAAIHQYVYKFDETVLTEGKAASSLGRTIEGAKPLLLELANYGFLSYDLDKGIVTVMPKLSQFVQAKAAKVDYDNIIFVSDMRPKSLDGYTREEIERDAFLRQMQEKYQKENQERRIMPHFGTMDLGSLDLNLRAIDRVTLSDFQNTQVFPENDMVTVKQNRNFLFTGWVNTGRWEIHLKDGSYDYDQNKLNIIESDMAYIRVTPFKEEDGKRAIRTFSSIAGLKGEILVDNPKNRSGMRQKEYTDYPKLISKTPTKVFYSDRKIQRGAYDSLRFYFTLDPFEFDSLDNFNEAAARFKGEMTSGGIFPKFREELKVMPDYSLGFVQQAPKEGYDFYGTGSKYKNKIVLSNNGLQGSGEIEYETSLSVSKAFTFMPDSTVGYAEFTNKPREVGIESPDIVGENVLVTYVPNGNVLKARSMQKPMKFFEGEAAFNGVAFVRPSGVKGRGAFDFKSANLSSLNFTFKRWDIIADTASFKLSDQQEGVHPDDALAFKTDNVQGQVSFKDRKGQFKSNYGEEMVHFPINQYVCRMDMFNWFMDQDELELYKDASSQLNIDTDLDLAGSNFFSTHKDQDSLNFLAPKARFEMRTKTIFCDKVEFIDVADARIYPDSMKVTIRKKAKMDELSNSRIVANYITKYHEIRKAQTNITAKKAYTSKGEYPYYDLDSNLYVIQLDKIYLDSSFQTVAEGKVDVSRNFKLSPQFDFYGNVKMNASNPNLLFKGATRINHNCESFAKNWMSFEARIDRLNIQIPVTDNMKTLEGKPISAGVVWQFSDNVDSTLMYPTFLSELRSAGDKKILSSTGLLQYTRSTTEFEIGTPEKLLNRGDVGNYVALNAETCSMTGDGKIDLGFDYGDVTVDAVGTVDYNQAKQETTMNITLKVNMPVDKGIFEKMAEGIAALPDLKPLDMNPTTLEQALSTWSSVKVADKFKSDYTLRGDVKKMPSELENTFILTGIRLKSISKDDEFRGLVSSKIEGSLVSVYSEPVLKSLPVQVAFYRASTGNRFGINIEVPGGKMYFFNYDLRKKDGIMSVYTSDKEMEEKIAALKPDKKKSKNFEYDVTSNPTYQSTFKRLLQ